MEVFTFIVMPDLEYHRTQTPTRPTNCTELFRVVVLLVHQVGLIKDLLRLLKADAVFSFHITAFLSAVDAARI